MLFFVCMARLLLAELVLDRSCITLPNVSIWWLRRGLWENRATGCVTRAAFSGTRSNFFMRRECTSCFEVGRSMIKVALWVSDSHAARRLILKVFWAGGIVWGLFRKYIQLGSRWAPSEAMPSLLLITLAGHTYRIRWLKTTTSIFVLVERRLVTFETRCCRWCLRIHCLESVHLVEGRRVGLVAMRWDYLWGACLILNWIRKRDRLLEIGDRRAFMAH